MKKSILLFVCILPAFVIYAQTKQKPPTIIWDSSSLTQISPKNHNNANYARMIQTGHDSLICVYEFAGSIQCTKSSDAGKTWQPPVTIVTKENGINMSVPDILQLKNHSLLVSYNPRPHKINGSWDSTKRFAICTIKSYDGGETWQDQRTIYQADFTFENGCWEPSQIQLPSGEIQLFFSDEGIYKQSNEQNISLFRSKDNGLTWTTQPAIVSFTPHHRDGMPVPLILQNKKQIVFSIEDNAIGQFKPSIIRNTFKQNWQQVIGINNPERESALLHPLPDTVYAGAPFLRQLHNGQTILSYQSNQNRSHNWELSCMQVAVGDDNAEHFIPVEEPFHISLNKHGLWNSLCISNDDMVIAITSTNAFGDGNSIWMLKGKLVNP